MKIAVAAKGNLISHHYLRCDGFRLYGFNGNTVDVLDYIENDFEDKAEISAHLASLGINIVLVGGIAQEEADKLNNLGVKVISKVKGDISEVIFALHRNEIEPYQYEHQNSCGQGCSCSGKTNQEEKDKGPQCGCGGCCS